MDDYELFQEQVLPKYATWLNENSKFEPDDPPVDPPYTVDSFDFSKLGGFFQGDIRVMVFYVNNGDDGGPATLTAYFDGPHLMYVVQEYDTAIDMVWTKEY